MAERLDNKRREIEPCAVFWVDGAVDFGTRVLCIPEIVRQRIALAIERGDRKGDALYWKPISRGYDNCADYDPVVYRWEFYG